MLTLLLTCEHGGNKVPPPFSAIFEGEEQVLASHAGYDIGALALFRDMEKLATGSFVAETSRLLVDLNRSSHHPDLFSVYIRPISNTEKKLILEQFYYPYRNSVEQAVQHFVAEGRQVLHVAVHTFTPELRGVVRRTAIGLLFDPKRKEEQTLCKVWKKLLQQQQAGLPVRFNYPYLGVADGLPTYLRRKFAEAQYLGIELEVNQRFPQGDQDTWEHLRLQLTTTLQQVLELYL